MTVEFSQVGIALGVLAALALAINQVWDLVQKIKDKPSPGDVQRESIDRFVSKSDFTSHVIADESAHDSLEEKIEKAANHDEESRRRIHNDIAGLSNKVAALDATILSTTAQIQRIDQYIMKNSHDTRN